MSSERPSSAPSEPPHLIAIGATTGVGGTSAVSMAAARAGLTRTERVSHGAGEDDWSNAVRVGTLSTVDREERADALLAAALAQIAPLLATAAPLRVHAWHAGPARSARLVAQRLRLHEAAVSNGAEHGSAGLLALESAWGALREQRADVVIVSAACVLSDSTSLARGRLEERVLGGTWSFGTVPGEAAVALVWATEKARGQLGLASLGRLLAIAHADEAIPFGGSVPCVGTALTSAIRSVLGALPRDQRAARIFCNLNGERERTDEWGFAVPRLSEDLTAPGAFVTPIGAFGDAEAATGLLLIALASALTAREGPHTAPCLIWASSREPARAAALFESPGGPSPIVASVMAPRWARALDDSLQIELTDEAGFRYDQRLFQYSGRADPEPRHIQLGLARIEGLLDAAVQGLADCGPRAWAHAETALTERPSPSALYAAARVAFEARERERGVRIIDEHLTGAPGFALAARLSIQHAPPLGEQAAPNVEAWLRAGPRFSALGVRLAAHSGLKPPLSMIRAAAEALTDDDEAEAAEFLAALCQLGSPETFELIGRWRLSRHARLRRCWANAALCLGRGSGQDAVLARAEQDPAVILPAALCADSIRARSLARLALALSGSDAVLALGILGDTSAIAPLIERLADPLLADAAGAALDLLLGGSPSLSRAVTEAPGGAPPPASPVRADAAAWYALARPIVERAASGSRLRGGAVASAAVTLQQMQRLHLPQRLRGYLGRELCVRWAVPRVPDVDLLLREQGLRLRALSRSVEASRPGAWN
jgi:3-oxoacyl-[acyl-carrier-protein] synthase I